MFITVNGQLLMTMLTESILLGTSAELLQANTDGITVKIPRTEYETVKFLMKEWEAMTELELEEATYTSMYIRDVNNYMAITEDGEYKFKGAFEIDKAWHKDHSMRIVPLAVARCLTQGISPEMTIRNHFRKDEYEDLEFKPGKFCKSYGIYDFCSAARAKGGGKYRTELVYEGQLIKAPLPKTNRYYVSNEGVYLKKVLPPNPNAKDILEIHREKFPNQLDMFHFVEDVSEGKERVSQVASGKKVTMFNRAYWIEGPDKFDELTAYDIDVDYYVKECYKILDKL